MGAGEVTSTRRTVSREQAARLPTEAKRRTVIVTIAHTNPITGPMADPRIRSLLGKWIAHGTLTDAEWVELARAVPKGGDA